MSVDHEKDLPVLANTNEILVQHFMLDLHCDLVNRVFSGSVLLFLDPALSSGPNATKQIFSIRDAGQHGLRKHVSTRVGESTIAARPPAAETHTKVQVLDPFIKTGLGPAPASVLINLPGTRPLSGVDKVELHPDFTALAANETENELNAKAGTTEDFHLVLDCCDLIFESVEEVDVSKELYSAVYEEQSTKCGGSAEEGASLFLQHRCCPGRPLRHSVEEWCLHVWKEGVKKPADFPGVIRIHYKTKPEGRSLRWTRDQSGSLCVYSAAMWVNNRALLPCQEYGSLSTWQAGISVPDSHVVVMSSDHQEHTMSTEQNGLVTFYHQCSSPLPSYTLALAVGTWPHAVLAPGGATRCAAMDEACHAIDLKPTCEHHPPCQINYSKCAVLPCRIFAPASLLQQAMQEFKDYYRRCSRAVQQILGPSPFGRVDFVMFPSCSQDMAMANGGLIFLSQSLLAKDGSMCIRLSHELTHFWFGLLIGAKDWTEEWLSEGFATFMEDSVHGLAMGWSEHELEEYSELRAMLRYRVLEGEMQNTEEQLQTLRPQKGCELRDSETSVMYVKDGMNPNKLFTQVHYLKGYFLLRHLSSKVGVSGFISLMKKYVIEHHGRLVDSQDFLNLVLEAFPELVEEGMTLDNLFKDWFDCPGMPKHLDKLTPSPNNTLYQEVQNQLHMWKKREAVNKRKRKRFKVDLSEEDWSPLEATQLVLLLEQLLQLKTMSAATLQQLRHAYDLSNANADVRHRWNELVVKHKYTKGYGDLRNFLINDQAMGVYLYGEMMISGCSTLRNLAQEVFSTVGADMEPGTYRVVHTMLYGS